MLGMIPGNGHPYSWSAIVNGYDPAAMASCPYPVIPVYLGKQPLESVRIPGAQVTHIWTENLDEARDVARAALIPNVVERPEDVIGHVDAVIISTDDGADHVRRARPFIEAGLPVFVDKPLATTREELAQFIAWHRAGARILSSSGLRYSPDYAELRDKKWRWITSTTAKSWERYGIHALEPVFIITGPGIVDVQCNEVNGNTIATLSHASGTAITIAVVPDAPATPNHIHAYGEAESRFIKLSDTYAAFRGQLVSVVEWLRSGSDPYPFEHTIELMAALIAGQESRACGTRVTTASVLEGVEALISSK